MNKIITFAKWLSPNFIRGVVGNIRWGLITNEPLRRVYKLLITSIKSEVFFTGKNLLRGTFIPIYRFIYKNIIINNIIIIKD